MGDQGIAGAMQRDTDGVSGVWIKVFEEVKMIRLQLQKSLYLLKHPRTNSVLCILIFLFSSQILNVISIQKGLIANNFRHYFHSRYNVQDVLYVFYTLSIHLDISWSTPCKYDGKVRNVPLLLHSCQSVKQSHVVILGYLRESR